MYWLSIYFSIYSFLILLKKCFYFSNLFCFSIIQDHIKGINFAYRVQLREKGITYLNKLGKFVGTNTLECTDSKVSKKYSILPLFRIYLNFRYLIVFLSKSNSWKDMMEDILSPKKWFFSLIFYFINIKFSSIEFFLFFEVWYDAIFILW